MGNERGSVAVVTDSTAGLSPWVVTDHRIRVVGLQVSLGDRDGVDGAEVSSAELTEALRHKMMVTTSRPSPSRFSATYQEALDAGAQNVLSIHLSAALSGTWESAVLAAQDFPYGTVRVVDARSTAMGLGFAVLAAVRAAEAGGSPAQVQQAAIATVDATRTLFYVDTLEYLRRGGRITTAAALLATPLAIKPLLHIVDGRIVPLEKVRTSAKAIARLAQLTVAAAGSGPVDIAVHHLAAMERAEGLAAVLRGELPELRELQVSELGAVVGAHLGPGVLGTVVVRRDHLGQD
jgi:DegV family protein with EDD domain